MPSIPLLLFPSNTLQHGNTSSKEFPSTRKRFQVSSMTSEKSVSHLLAKLEEECKRIFTSHSLQIPTSYRELLRWIETENKSSTFSSLHQADDDLDVEDHQQYFVTVNDLHSKYSSSLVAIGLGGYGGSSSVAVMRCILRYFNCIGHVVMVDGDNLH